jgi:hypothetical protein
VFTTTGTGPIKGWSKYKARLDGKMLEALRQQAQADAMPSGSNSTTGSTVTRAAPRAR